MQPEEVQYDEDDTVNYIHYNLFHVSPNTLKLQFMTKESTC